MSSNERTTAVHINLVNLPVEQRDKLCSVLDQNQSWIDLGHLMQFNEFQILVSLIYILKSERIKINLFRTFNMKLRENKSHHPKFFLINGLAMVT